MSQVTHPLAVISAAQRKLQNIDGSFGEFITFCLVFWSQYGDRDVIGALLSRRVSDCHLKRVDSFLEATDLQQPWMC